MATLATEGVPPHVASRVIGVWINEHYAVDDEQALAVIRANPLATIVASDPLHAAHLPILVETQPDGVPYLVGHVPRVDPISAELTGSKEVLLIFHGPVAYVSPHWYASPSRLPTYNFVTTHVMGIATPMERDEELREHLMDLIRFHELHHNRVGTPSWDPGPEALARTDQLLPYIVGFHVRITSVQSKYKLGQNCSVDESDALRRALRQSAHTDDLAIADMMDRIAAGRPPDIVATATARSRTP